LQTETTEISKSSSVSLAQHAIQWSLMFLISMGLGYPTLNRYDPAKVPGLYDAYGYASLVTGTNLAGDEAHRILVPYLARPIYWLANGHLGTWDPVFFALLAVNSLFIATTAHLLVGISYRLVGDYAIALLSGLLYLLNFAVANYNLSGYVDSAVNCGIILLAWSLLSDRWWMLPLWGILGSLAKETFIPLSAVFAFAWWITTCRQGSLRLSRLVWIGAMVAAGFATVYLVMSRVTPGFTPIAFAASRQEQSGAGHLYMDGLIRCLMARETFFVFGWLVPLGIWRLGRLPRPFVIGSACAGLAALAMGAYDDALGNTVRPMFSALGPVLSLSASILLVEIGARDRITENRRA
jgi:hypothetical protein